MSKRTRFALALALVFSVSALATAALMRLAMMAHGGG